MASSAELPGLPNELLYTISGCLDTRDLLVLCRTSRQMHAICLKWIYQNITLNDPAQVIRFFRTVNSRPEVSDSVREFDMSWAPRIPLKSFYATVKAAVNRLNNVRILRLPISPLLFQLFSDAHFPQLCQCAVPSSVGIMPFLDRHRQISTLRVLPSDGALGLLEAFQLTSYIPPIHMPKLRQFEGPAIVAFSVVPGSSTSHLTIYWDAASTRNLSYGLAGFARSNVDIVRLTNVVYTWDRGLLSATTNHLPRLEELVVYLGVVPDPREKR
ncbi:hypothetical protein B0H17DRAFT_1270911 [Mycena rosella]|uniref:F-box domain-containing protein n=1 Tax=Mycena rosella TaxID=1033263 RepID=A0AAD7FXX0_MYCRO|nr:hypothetical protein B0H17DRAFT_1270911 [Mycena rosella]